MISLIRKFPCNSKAPSGHLGKILRDIFTCKNIPNSQIVKKATKRFTGSETRSRKLQFQGSQYRNFDTVFSDILCDLRDIIGGYKFDTSAWLTNVLEYNLRNSEKNICLLTVLTYENLVKQEDLNSENMRLACILGWWAEILNTDCMMFDDIIDKSCYRRGQPCWHTLDGVGLHGINDAVLVENTVFALLKKNFRHLECYLPLMELFNEMPFIACCAESLDMECASRCVSSFNMETYNNMAVNKVAYDNYYLPFSVAVQLAGFTDEEVLRQCKAILLEFGLFFQIQNDFLDCFGTLETAGKIGTDIQDNKPSWLAVTCMERATDEQKQIMIECYGKNDPNKVERVKELYKVMDLPGVYAAYEEESYKNTRDLIVKTSNHIPKRLFLRILKANYPRGS